MKWEGDAQSSNIEDNRGRGKSKKGLAIGGGAGGILIIILGLIFGVDLNKLGLNQPGQNPGNNADVEKPYVETPDEKRNAALVATVLKYTEDVWLEQFPKNYQKNYRVPKLQLFSDETNSACGFADAATGPFYCPGDDKVYIDLSFFVTLEKDLNAPGEFPRAYVIAHEVGHHVQNLLGYNTRVQSSRGAEKNQMSVRLELQADYLAGASLRLANDRKLRSQGIPIVEPGDLRAAMQAASHIGDDYLQKRAKGRIQPDAFTHGTSEQRIKYMQLGYQKPDLSLEMLDRFFTMRYSDL